MKQKYQITCINYFFKSRKICNFEKAQKITALINENFNL